MKSLEQYRVEKLFESAGEPSNAVKAFVNGNAKVRWDGMSSFLNKFDITNQGDRAEAMDHINDMIGACNMLKSKIGAMGKSPTES